jgi:hypothetical protein
METTTTIVRDKREKRDFPGDEEKGGVRERVKTRHPRGRQAKHPPNSIPVHPSTVSTPWAAVKTYIVNSLDG